MDKEKTNLKSEYESKLNSNEVIILLKQFVKDSGICGALKLTGGAVVDILDGRVPKDYDLIGGEAYMDMANRLKDSKDIVLLFSSKTAFTFLFKDKYIVQLLRTDPSEFLFEIEKSEFSLKEGKLSKFDYLGYKSRILIPNTVNYEMGKKSLQNFKARIKKWTEKGFAIHPITYNSYRPFLRNDSLVKKIFKIIFIGNKGYES